MELEGMIIRDLGETGGTSKAGNIWKKHEYVIETMSGNFPRRVKFHVFGDRCNTLTFEQGKSYVVQFDLESREFNERWYTDVNVYSARPIEGGIANMRNETINTPEKPVSNSDGPFGPQTEAPKNPFQNQAPDFSQSDSQEDLPF